VPTLHTSEKTDPGMLAQSQAVASCQLTTSGVGTMLAVDTGPPTDRTGGVQHDRGETSVGVGNQQESHPCLPEPSGRQGVSSSGRKTPPCSTTARVFVIDRHPNPAVPCHPAKEPVLLASGRARVRPALSVDRLVIRLVDRVVAGSVVTGVGIDQGPKFTEISVFRSTPAGRVVLLAIDVRHLGQLAHKKMQQRPSYRRGRRSRNLRYRTARLGNRTRRKGWLAPSLRHRADTTLSMVTRLRRWAPARLPTKSLSGSTHKSWEPWGDCCGAPARHARRRRGPRVPAGKVGADLSLLRGNRRSTQHRPIRPKASGNYNRVSNLALARVVPSYQSRGKDALKARLALAFGPGAAGIIAKRVLAHTTLQDSAAVNTTRWALCKAPRATGLPVATEATGPGGRTKWNRHWLGVPKTHTLDALCIGNITGVLSYPTGVIVAKATGRGKYSRTTSGSFGCPRRPCHGSILSTVSRPAISCGLLPPRASTQWLTLEECQCGPREYSGLRLTPAPIQILSDALAPFFSEPMAGDGHAKEQEQ